MLDDMSLLGPWPGFRRDEVHVQGVCLRQGLQGLDDISLPGFSSDEGQTWNGGWRARCSDSRAGRRYSRGMMFGRSKSSNGIHACMPDSLADLDPLSPVAVASLIIGYTLGTPQVLGYTLGIPPLNPPCTCVHLLLSQLKGFKILVSQRVSAPVLN